MQKKGGRNTNLGLGKVGPKLGKKLPRLDKAAFRLAQSYGLNLPASGGRVYRRIAFFTDLQVLQKKNRGG